MSPSSVFLILLFSSSSAFNLDLVQPIFRTGPPNSSFGFSLSQHFLRSDHPVLLVGAPRADSGQPGTDHSGAVFVCPLADEMLDQSGRNTRMEAEVCNKLQIEYPTKEEFRHSPQRLNSKSLHPEGKNHQLLGFVVQSSGRREQNDNRAMACAPLLRWSPNAYTDGVCYLLSAELNHSGVLSPCNPLPKKDRHNDYGACEHGFSAFIDNHVILTGLPGARKWTGGVFARYEFTDSDGFPDSVDRWTMEVNKEQRGIINVLTSHDYLGYSVRYGHFGFWHEQTDKEGDGGMNNFTVVSGATRFNQTGAVVFLPFRRNVQVEEQRQLGLLEDHFVLTGAQLGSGFGSAIEVIDLDGNGFDDLLVGAPFEYFFTDDHESPVGGAVYVYYSNGVKQTKGSNDKVFHAPIVLRARSAHSQFGTALSRLGNVDNDPNGYQDFAVGAPQSDSGLGSVFIFHGDKFDEFSTSSSQEIHAKKLNERMGRRRRRMNTFGGALAGGVDMDGDGYGELAVGAHGSDTVVLFRARPVVDVHLEHSFPQKYVKIDGDHSCASAAQSCFSLLTSLRFPSLRSSDSVARLLSRHFPSHSPFLCRLQVIPFAKGISPRAVFATNGANLMEWQCGRRAVGGTEETARHELFVPKGNQDWTSRLRFNFSVSVQPNSAEPGSPLPIVNRAQQEHRFEIAFDKNCGEDNECHSDLALHATLLEMTKREDGVYMAKVTERDSLVVRFLVENRRESAYLAKLFVEYNNDELDEPQLVQKERQKETPKLDIERRGEGIAIVGLGNPMEGAGRKLSFDMVFKLVRGSSERISASLHFRALVNSSSVEDVPDNNEWSAEMLLIKEADLQLEGASRPPIVRFSRGNRLVNDELDIGPHLIHAYTITNRGPFYARNVTVKIDWPLRLNTRHSLGPASSSSQLSYADWILYTLEEPLVRHNGKARRCPIPIGEKAINPMGIYNDETLKLDYQLRTGRTRGVEPEKGRKQLNGEEIRETSVFGNQNIRAVHESSGAMVRVADINCNDGSALCVPLICHFEYIGRNDSALIEIRARLWNYTFSADYRAIEYVAISSQGFIEVDPSQGILEDVKNNFARVTTHAYPDRPQQESQLRIWMLIMAVAIGMVLLALLVLCCWCLGFFKRPKRPDLHLHRAHYEHNREFEQ